MSDTYVYEDSMESQMTLEPFVSRQVLYAIDQNQGNYTSQIQLDTSSLSNSGKYANYQDAHFEMPLVLRLTATSANAQVAAIQNLDSSFALALKSGYFNFIHSISVEYNNTSVVQLTPYTNFYVNFKLLTSFSKDTLAKYGALLGFYPDSAEAVRYGSQTLASPAGHGSINNSNLPQFPSSVYSYQALKLGATNTGMYWRQANTTAFDPTAAAVAPFVSASQAGTIGLNYFRKGTGTDINCKWFFVLAVIRLKDISDFFAQLPLIKGAFLRFIINTNTSTHNLSITATGVPATPVSDVSVTQNIITGGSTPLMIADASTPGNGMHEIAAACSAIGAGVYDFQIACSIARDTTFNVSHPTLQQVRLYCPVYQFNPVNEEQYLSLNKIKTIRYKDIYQYQVDVQCSGSPGNFQGTFNALLTNGIPNPKSLIIIPMIGTSSNNTGAGISPIAPFASPFASEPSTTSPYINLTQWNVQVAGITVFVQNQLYDFESFKNELVSMNAINGSQVDGMDSGLIGYSEFQSIARYYVVDLSRRLPAEDRVPKSLQILGTVQSGSIANVSLYCFVEFEKEVQVDLETGAKIM